MSAATARSWLFAPGDRPERFGKAAASGADAVILDLEDAVAPGRKPVARDQVGQYLTSNRAFVRINAAGTEWHDDDLRMVTSAPGLLGIVLPKSDSADVVTSVAEALTAPLVTLIESALGVQNAPAIAAQATRLAFGNLDFSLDAGTGNDETALLYARSVLVLASRAAGLPGPIDGVTTSIDDPAIAARDAAHGRNLGFAGKLCVHPNQVSVVNSAYSYDSATVDWACRVVRAAGASGGAAVRVDGQMIDKPRLELAQRVNAAVLSQEPAL